MYPVRANIEKKIESKQLQKRLKNNLMDEGLDIMNNKNKFVPSLKHLVTQSLSQTSFLCILEILRLIYSKHKHSILVVPIT